MTHIDVTLHLVNRTLRHAGHREALPREEEAIRALAAQGMSVEWIAAYVTETASEFA